MKEGIPAEQVFDIISRHMLPDVFPLVLDLEKSQGSRLVCRKTGKTYLDCFSFIASLPVGHNHPMMFDQEFERTLLRAARSKPSLSDIYTEEMAAFVQTFSRVAIPADLPNLFLIEGGTLAVENAMKVAFDWKVRKNFLTDATRERGTQIIHFEQAFHGRSGYCLSVTNTADPRKTKYFPKFQWPRIKNPTLHFPLTSEVLTAVIELEEEAVVNMRRAFELFQDDIAAILIEPIQGEGGDNHFRAEFHQALRNLADEYDVMLIYDEVQTGLGATGKVWAYQHYGVTPDVISFGKKAQVCGILAGQLVREVENNVFEESSRINSTWGGNLTDMVRATRFLEIIEAEKLIENAANVGAFLLQSLQNLAAKFPDLFTNTRGRGLMCACDLPNAEIRDRVVARLFEEQVILLKCGQKSIRFRPSLVFSHSEVLELVQALEKVAKEVRANSRPHLAETDEANKPL